MVNRVWNIKAFHALSKLLPQITKKATFPQEKGFFVCRQGLLSSRTSGFREFWKAFFFPQKTIFF